MLQFSDHGGKLSEGWENLYNGHLCHRFPLQSDLLRIVQHHTATQYQCLC